MHKYSGAFRVCKVSKIEGLGVARKSYEWFSSFLSSPPLPVWSRRMILVFLRSTMQDCRSMGLTYRLFLSASLCFIVCISVAFVCKQTWTPGHFCSLRFALCTPMDREGKCTKDYRLLFKVYCSLTPFLLTAINLHIPKQPPLSKQKHQEHLEQRLLRPLWLQPGLWSSWPSWHNCVGKLPWRFHCLQRRARRTPGAFAQRSFWGIAPRASGACSWRCISLSSPSNPVVCMMFGWRT